MKHISSSFLPKLAHFSTVKLYNRFNFVYESVRLVFYWPASPVATSGLHRACKSFATPVDALRRAFYMLCTHSGYIFDSLLPTYFLVCFLLSLLVSSFPFF